MSDLSEPMGEYERQEREAALERADILIGRRRGQLLPAETGDSYTEGTPVTDGQTQTQEDISRQSDADDRSYRSGYVQGLLLQIRERDEQIHRLQMALAETERKTHVR